MPSRSRDSLSPNANRAGESLILHLADHDHSGREIERALRGDISAWVTELGGRVEVKNIALTDEQIDEYDLYWEEVWAVDCASVSYALTSRADGVKFHGGFATL